MPVYLSPLIGDGLTEDTAFRTPTDGVGWRGHLNLRHRGGFAIVATSEEVTGERRLFKLGDLPDEALTRRQLGEIETRLGLPPLAETRLGAVVDEVRRLAIPASRANPLRDEWETDIRPLPAGRLPRVRRLKMGKMLLFQSGVTRLATHRTIVAQDDFDSLGTSDLNGRTMSPTDPGVNWSATPTTGGMGGDGSGGVSPTSGSDEGFYDSGINDFYAQIKYHPHNVDNRFGIQAYLTGESHNDPTPTGYHCNIQPNANVMRLFERTSGGFSLQDDDTTTTLPNNAQATWRLEIIDGASEKLFGDIGSGMTEFLTSADGTHTVEALSFAQFLLNATGPTFDDWEVDNLAVVGGPGGHGLLLGGSRNNLVI